jgi:hypothetical protein
MIGYGTYLDECRQMDVPLVGHLAMVSISDTPVNRDELIQNFNKHDVTTGYVPAPTREVDAWKKACAAINGSKFSLNGERVTYLVRDLTGGMRAVMQEVTDSDNKRLSYRPVATTFVTPPDRSGGRTVRGTGGWHWMDADPKGAPIELTDDETEQVKFLRARFDEVAKATYTMMDGSRMRRTVLGTLGYLNGFEIRPSVYFVPVSNAEKLSHLTQALGETTDSVRMILIPLIDSATQRQLVIEAYQNESQDQMSTLLKDTLECIQQIKGGTAVRYATLTNLANSYKEQVKRAQVYAVEMEMGLGHLRETSDMVAQAIQSLKEMI